MGQYSKGVSFQRAYIKVSCIVFTLCQVLCQTLEILIWVRQSCIRGAPHLPPGNSQPRGLSSLFVQLWEKPWGGSKILPGASFLNWSYVWRDFSASGVLAEWLLGLRCTTFVIQHQWTLISLEVRFQWVHHPWQAVKAPAHQMRDDPLTSWPEGPVFWSFKRCQSLLHRQDLENYLVLVSSGVTQGTGGTAFLFIVSLLSLPLKRIWQKIKKFSLFWKISNL